MIKRILVPLDPSQFCQAALDSAIDLAQRHDAELTAMVILDMPGIHKAIGPVPLGARHFAETLKDAHELDAQSRIEQLISDFTSQCDRNDVKHREAEYQGIPSKLILEYAQHFDLLCLGQETHFHFETSDRPGDSMEKILDHTATPIYAFPAGWKPVTENRRTLIAYNGSLSASRALQRYAQLMDPADTHIILLAANMEWEIGSHYLKNAEEFLQAHGFKDVKQEWTSKSVIEAVSQTFLAEVDEVVAGSHSRRGFLDFKLGDMSRWLIRESDKPLFLVA
jgi:nucleotide-binding universal stress UspA family protein